jgi:drug/metabolite transporter (DMT)-like permease
MAYEKIKSHARLPGITAAIAAVTIWAAWIPVTRLGVTTSLEPIDLAALRFFTAGLCLLPLTLRYAHQIPWRQPFALLCLIGGAGAPYVLAFGYGLKIANSGQGAILGPGAMPIFVSLLAALVLKEYIPTHRRIGILIGSVGVIIIVASDALNTSIKLEGFALILLASCLWAIHTIASRMLNLSPFVSTMIISVGNGVLLLPLYWVGDGFSRLAAVPVQDIMFQAFFQGIVVAIVALLLFSFAVQRLGASATGAFPPLSPVIASVIGYMLLGDTLDLPSLLGLVAVLAGVLIAARETSILTR